MNAVKILDCISIWLRVLVIIAWIPRGRSSTSIVTHGDFQYANVCDVDSP